MRNAMSPVPPRHVEHLEGLAGAAALSMATKSSFHSRCRPPDMRSFIWSYREATLANTSFTMVCFWDASTSVAPKGAMRRLVGRSAIGADHRRARLTFQSVEKTLDGATKACHDGAMPELPEVETVRRGLETAMLGRRIEKSG